MRKAMVAVVILVVLSGVAALAADAKVETIGALAEAAAPEDVRQVLEAKGYRVLLDDGSVVCEIWLRQSVPAQAKQDVPGVAYPQLAEATLVGVIHFPKAATDYRGQAIQAGFYTLRYELLPNDANHLGAAPNRDFVLLAPVGTDADPNAAFKFQELAALSRKATGTKHPGAMNLAPAEGTTPAVTKDEQKHWIFSAGMKLGSGEEIPFALVVKGTAQQ